jgi:Tfp pilus assembly protein PilF
MIMLMLLITGCVDNMAHTNTGLEQQKQELVSKAQASLENKDYLLTRDYLKQYTAIADQTAETLWIGVLAEYALGNQRAVSAYVQQLREQYPDTEEYQAYLALLRRTGYGH